MTKLLFYIFIINYVNGFLFQHKPNYKTALSKQVKEYNYDYYDEFYEVDYNIKYNSKKEKYTPTTFNQYKYVNYLQNNNVSLIFGMGPAGTGKTLFACVQAINALKNKSISKIILTRPIIAVEDENIGFLPGTLKHKMDPWTKPIFDIFLEYYRQSDIDYMIKESIIEISPLSFMRGRTFKNAFIIADEMQNSTPNQMLMLITRIGINSKMVITGDLLQSDRTINNGLYDIINRINNYKPLDIIKIVEMDKNDIQRSNIVKEILNIYDK